MADIKVSTRFDAARGRMRLVFSERIDYLEMSLDQAISVLGEVINRCHAQKLIRQRAPESKKDPSQ